MADYNSMDDIKPSALTAELVAGMRHIAEETPENKALCTPMSRMLGRMIEVVAPQAVVNVPQARTQAFRYLAEQHFPPEGVENPVYVELASGFSARPLHLARAHPNAQIIEMDVPDVIADKQKRYANAGIELPANLEFSSGDITQQNLAQCLDGRQAHIVVAEGLLIYLERQNIHELCQNLLPGMADGAHFIAEVVFASKEDLTTLGNIIRMMRRNTGSDVARGRVESKEQGIELFQTGGFVNTQAYLFEDLADKTQLTEPNRNLLLILDGEKG